MSDLSTLPTNLYGNIEIRSHLNEFMFFCGKKKLEWYLEEGLLENTELENIYRFRKPMKGNGHRDGTEYFKEKRINQCVICGVKEGLQRHHVVPLRYRMHFPKEFINHRSYDVLMVCISCHDKYERYSNQFDEQLMESLVLDEHTRELIDLSMKVEKQKLFILTISTQVKALKRFLDKEAKIPEKRVKQLLNELSVSLKRDIRLDNIEVADNYCNEELDKIERMDIKNLQEIKFKVLVKNYSSILDFCIAWRKHFLKHTEPKFLSSHWIAIHESYL